MESRAWIQRIIKHARRRSPDLEIVYKFIVAKDERVRTQQLKSADQSEPDGAQQPGPRKNRQRVKPVAYVGHFLWVFNDYLF